MMLNLDWRIDWLIDGLTDCCLCEKGWRLLFVFPSAWLWHGSQTVGNLVVYHSLKASGLTFHPQTCLALSSVCWTSGWCLHWSAVTTQYVCARLTKDDCFWAGAAPPRLENCGLQMWKTRQRGGNRTERIDGGGGGEEGKEKRQRGESGLDCKWDSTSTFTRKINVRGGYMHGPLRVKLALKHQLKCACALCPCCFSWPHWPLDLLLFFSHGKPEACSRRAACRSIVLRHHPNE